MGESTGMKLIVNPDDEKVEKGVHAGEMEGQTVKQYWVKHNGLTVYCNDVPEGSYRYITKEWKVKPNKSNPKL